MWNCLDLKCPVDDVCEYGLHDQLILEDLPNLISLLTSSAEVLTEDHPIWTEIKVFQSVQAKYKRILHCDKCLHLLQRVGGSLRKMVLLNLSKSYLDLAEHLLVGLQNQNQKIILPSRQQLEYVLIRTQSAVKLICEALHYSRETFCYLIQRLKVGHLVLNLMMATSITARVNIFFKGILVQLMYFYRIIFSWLKKLKSGTSEWPQPLDLPNDLETWLKLEDKDLLKPKLVPKEQLDFLNNIVKKSQSTASFSNDSDSDVVEIVDEVVNKRSAAVSRKNMNVALDVGEVIPRSSVVPTKKKDVGSQALKKSQKLLLKKIDMAISLKNLRIIWNNLDIASSNLLPKALIPKKIRLVDKMFADMKQKIADSKKLNSSPTKKRKDIALIVKSARMKFATYLGLHEPGKGTASGSCDQSFEELKPVHTFKELKTLYKSLYLMLQVSQQYEKCHKLKKVFKSRKEDIKLLIENNDKAIAKNLIFCTSKVFLTRFKC